MRPEQVSAYGAHTSATSVTVSVDSGTATAGTDFATVNDFMLTIPANRTEETQTFALIPTDDNVAEGAETLAVSGNTNDLAVDSATLTITDNDTASNRVTLSVDPTSVSEGAGSTTVTVTGTLNGGASTSATPVTVSVDSGTATAGTDFAAVNSFALTIPANQTEGTQTFSLIPTDDNVAEGAETLTVRGSTNDLNVDSATLTINDNDTASTKVALSVDPASVSEGAGSTTVTVTGTLDGGARTSATPVAVSVGGGTATAGTDFATVNDFTLTIPANQTEGTQTFRLIPTDDDVAEGTETLTVRGRTNDLNVDSATLTITDNDTASTKVTLSVDPTSVSEGAGSTTVMVTGTLDGGARTSATSVTVSVSGGTATAGTDFATVNDFTLTIPANQTEGTQTFALIPTDDNIAESSESLTVSGSANGLSVDSATLTITDNDTASTRVTLSVDPTSVSEGAGSTTVTVTGTLNGGASTSATPVTVSVYSGTATSGTDFATVNDFTLTIPANQTEGTQTFTLIPTDDNIAESSESLTVSGSANGLSVDSATLTITDNDTASNRVTLSVDPTSVSEGAGSTTVTVTGTLNGGASTSATPVTVSVDSGTATSGTDFATVNDFTLTIPANQTEGTQTFSLNPTDDNVAEGAETLAVSGTANGLAVDSATLTITDNDTASTRVTLSVKPTSVSEGAGSTTVTVTGTLDRGASTSATPVTVSVDSGTATAGTDFATVNDFTLTIPANQTEGTQTFSLNPTDDNVAEGTETLTVSGTANGLAVDSATLTITDNDTASTRVTLSVNPTSVSEGDGSTTITVTGTLNQAARPGGTPVAVLVGDGTAMAGMDFTPVGSFTLTIPANEKSGTETFTLIPTDDGVAEGNETVTVGGSATASGLTVESAELTLTENDTASTKVTLTLNPSQVPEGVGSTTVTVTGTLNEAARPGATSVTVSVAGGTATAGTDFTPVTSFTLTIPAKAKSGQQTFVLIPTDDGVAEGAETVMVRGTSGLSVDSATLEITDNDTPSTRVTLTLNPSQVSEGAGSATVTVTGRLDEAARPSPTSVTVSVAGGTATAGADFTPVNSFTLTIPAGATVGTQTFSLSPTDDNVAEGAETLTVAGSSDLTVDSATLTITDNDTASTKVTLTLSPTRVSEDVGATTVTVTGRLNEAARPGATSVTVAVDSGTAISGTDFTAVNGFTLTIPAGATVGTQTFSLNPTDDNVHEGDETLTVSGTTELTVDGATLTLVDNDAAPTKITLSVNPNAVSEGVGTASVTVTGTLDGSALSTPTSVTVEVESGTAISGTDFTAVNSFTLTIPATAMSGDQTFSFVPTDDNVAEGDETVTVTVSTNPEGLSVNSAVLEITDNDTLPGRIALSVNPDAVSEDATSTTVTVTATLDGAALPTSTDVTVSVEDGTAISGTDFTAVDSFTLTIDAESKTGTGTFSLTPTDDEVAEGAETLTVSGEASDLTVDAATVTIDDNDTASANITLSVDPDAVSEDAGSATITVTATLDNATRTTSTEVTVSVGDGTAMAGMDFTAVDSFTLTIDAESETGTRTFTLVPTDDGVAEGPETLTVSGEASGLTVDSATVTIDDNDSASATVTLSVDPDTVAEDADATTITVTATLNDAARPDATEVTVSVGDGTATAGTDFATVADFTLTIPAKATSGEATFSLTLADDEVAEGEETLTVSGSASGLTVDPAAVTITDNDTSTGVTLDLSQTEVAEDAGDTEVTVTAALVGAVRSTATTVTVSVVSGTATEVEDFDEVQDFTLTIEANERSAEGTFTLTPVDDADPEENETVEVRASTGGVTVTQFITITDNDAQQRVKLSMLDSDSEWVMEGGGPKDVWIKAELTGEPRSTVTKVMVSMESGTAKDGEDFVTVPEFEVTIEPTKMSETTDFTFEPVDDEEEEETETIMMKGTSDLPVDPATLMIKDNDGPSTGITLSVRPREVVEDAGPARVRVTAVLDDRPSDEEPVTIQVTVDEDEDDYGLNPAVFEVEIPEGKTSATATFILSPVADSKDERDQWVAITGRRRANGEAPTTEDLEVSATGLTIKDDDEANRPPKFSTQSYAFNLPEQQDGREEPIALGAVSARDPDGDQVRYSLVAGDAARFTVASRTGDLAYVGPGEDFETGPRQYELTVQARDGNEGKRPSAQVVVTVTDVPEAPLAVADQAELPEDVPTVVDVLANDSDPDGDSLRIVAVTAPAHGTATVDEGGVRYAPSSNYHGSDEFRYTVADPGGLSATATVTLTVTPVNDPPDAVDDEAETLEDEALVIDVLANDTDPDGDPLRIVSATAPAHGTATAGAGGVRYAPALNYHGQDSFDYTIADPGGLTDTATVTVTVLPVNDAPQAVGVIPDQPLEEGGEPLTLDIAPYFTDVDGDALTYTAESSNPAATVVAINGSTLTLSAVVRGAATVTVTATDPDGLTATQVFGVSVGDRLVREVLTDTLAALGRGHLSSVRQTVGRRLETGGTDTQRLTVAGQAFGPEAWDRVGSGSLAQTHDLLFRAATLQQRATATDMVGTSADPRLRQPGSFTSFGGFSGDWDQALPATDILMAFGGDDASTEEPTGGGPRWTVWGQGDLQTFRGTPEPVKGYEGDLRTGYLGVDAQVTRHWLLGVAMARSGGSGAWQRGASAGELSTTLTRVHPYVRWADGDTAVWGVFGAGRGTATHVRTLTGMGESSPLSLGLGLLEGRRRVATVGRGFDIGVRAEASWAHLATGGGDETIDDLEAGVRRVRGGVEVTRALSGPGGLTLTPFGAVSTRHDGGAGQTGVGLEVAGGLRLRGGRVQLEAQGRRLVLHSATAYEEQGVSLAATVGSSPYEPGLTLSLRPNWGAGGMGAETLWQDQIQSFMPGSAYDQTGMDARLGYGLRLGRDGLVTPFGSYGQRQNSGRRLQVGTLVGTLGQTPGSLHGPFQIEVSGERYDRPGGNADHRFSMFGVVNLGGSAPAYGTATGIDPRLHVPASDLPDTEDLPDTVFAPPAPAPDAAPPRSIESAILTVTSMPISSMSRYGPIGRPNSMATRSRPSRSSIPPAPSARWRASSK